MLAQGRPGVARVGRMLAGVGAAPPRGFLMHPDSFMDVPAASLSLRKATGGKVITLGETSLLVFGSAFLENTENQGGGLWKLPSPNRGQARMGAQTPYTPGKVILRGDISPPHERTDPSPTVAALGCTVSLSDRGPTGRQPLLGGLHCSPSVAQGPAGSAPDPRPGPGGRAVGRRR